MKQYIFTLLLLVFIIGAQAQHDHSTHGKTPQKTTTTTTPAKTPVPSKKTKKAKAPVAAPKPIAQPVTKQDTIKAAEPVTNTEHTGHMDNKTHEQVMVEDTIPMAHDVPMSHAFSLNLPMTRNGSGTGWLPDASPMYGYMLHSKKWMYMFHGNIFVRYNSQDITDKGTRGDSKVDAPNWFMAMGQRKVGERGLFRFSTMFSLDPLFGGEGYPLLFQTGETFEGRPLVDRQHPHNLFSEVSVAYTYMFSEDVDAFVYLGYPGEPALGPVAFMHRPSSQNNLDSPLGHHWQDATHITFGVATLGFRYKIFKIEGSLFTGREPGEARYGFDKPRFDSYSYRISANPHPQLALQASHAFLKSPEPVHPDEDVRRTTASVLHSLPLRDEGNYNLTSGLIWGFNDAGGDHKEHSVTLESNLQLHRFAVYGRYEWIEKSAEELQVEGFGHDRLFSVNALTLGANFVALDFLKTNLAIGIQGSIYLPAEDLKPVYGDNPLAGQVYIRLYPKLMNISKKPQEPDHSGHKM